MGITRTLADSGIDPINSNSQRDTAPALRVYDIACMAAGKNIKREQYTVAWLCALPKPELIAARLMLDEEHAIIELLGWDQNVCYLGSINGHNTVIACIGRRGSSVLGWQLRRSFPNLQMHLLVVLGGGIPGNPEPTSTKETLFTGDVIMGWPQEFGAPAVVHLNVRASLGNGTSILQESIQKPSRPVMAALAKLMSNQNDPDRHFSKHLERTCANMYLSKPGSKHDNLFHADCIHTPVGAPDCDFCSKAATVQRVRRLDDRPVIHQGTIMSDNSVIQDGEPRDRLSRDYQSIQQHSSIRDVLCFITETPGFTNLRNCLVIKGITYYADPHKHPTWAGYAAATAAAFARELLCNIKSIKSLNFVGIGHRYRDIKEAHALTCKWILYRSEYWDWLNPMKISESNGVLWIKGKPGAGKSTVMKFLHTNVKRTMQEESISISFFFNYSSQLERSTAGMYRSLLFQLLERQPRLQSVLYSLNLPSAPDQWELDLLKATFRCAVENLGQEHLLCYVDALDECTEGDVQDAISFFESLALFATTNKIHLRLCFSIRYFSMISGRVGLQLTLEDEDHSIDIANYLSTELRIGTTEEAQELRAHIVEKASGVFLWAVLVVRDLNRVYEDGDIHTVSNRLAELPSEMAQLYKDVLSSQQEAREFALCVRWILYAQRPLTLEELFSAIVSGLDPQSSLTWDVNSFTPEYMKMFIFRSSKGLTETTGKGIPTVRFIHASIRDFFLREHDLTKLMPEVGGITEGLSHETLKNCCYNYLLSHAFDYLQLPGWPPPSPHTDAMQLRNSHPFLEYAVQNVLRHADAAEKNGIAQKTFLDDFAFELWMKLDSLLERGQIRPNIQEASLLQILIERDLPYLTKGLQKSSTAEPHITSDSSPIFGKNLEQSWDMSDSESDTFSVCSMVSNSSASSLESNVGMDVWKAALDEIIAFLLSDQDLPRLFSEALLKRGSEKTSRNGIRLLKLFGRRFMAAATEQIEKEAARLFLSRRRNREIIDMILQETNFKLLGDEQFQKGQTDADVWQTKQVLQQKVRERYPTALLEMPSSENESFIAAHMAVSRKVFESDDLGSNGSSDS